MQTNQVQKPLMRFLDKKGPRKEKKQREKFHKFPLPRLKPASFLIRIYLIFTQMFITLQYKGGIFLFGLHDPWITLVYALCAGSTLLCILYGAINWNKGGVEVKKEKIIQWGKEEEELEK